MASRNTIWSRSYELKDAFLKELKLVEIRVAGSNVFHSIMDDGKKVFLKTLCLIFIKGLSLLVFFVLEIVLLEQRQQF